MLNYQTSSSQIVSILSNKVSFTSNFSLLTPLYSVEKISKLLSREVVEANIFNDNLMTILAAFILQLSPFLDNTPMDDQRIVDEGKPLHSLK